MARQVRSAFSHALMVGWWLRPNRSLKGDPHRQANVGRDTVHVIIGLAAHTAFPVWAP